MKSAEDGDAQRSGASGRMFAAAREVPAETSDETDPGQHVAGSSDLELIDAAPKKKHHSAPGGSKGKKHDAPTKEKQDDSERRGSSGSLILETTPNAKMDD